MGHIILLVIHVGAATVALFSGFAALYLRKGSPRHRAAGNIFFGSMLVMAISAVCLALEKEKMIDVVAGGFTFYMVSTGWLVVRRKPGQTGAAERTLAALGVATSVFAFVLGWGALKGAADESLTVPYFAFSFLSMFAVVLDLSLFVRARVSHEHRIARHVWRLCIALLITATSFFMPTRFSLPEPIMKSHLNYVPVLYVVAAMVFWLARLLSGGGAKYRAGVTPKDLRKAAMKALGEA